MRLAQGHNAVTPMIVYKIPPTLFSSIACCLMAIIFLENPITVPIRNHYFYFFVQKSKKDSKNQESIQSSTIEDTLKDEEGLQTTLNTKTEVQPIMTILPVNPIEQEQML